MDSKDILSQEEGQDKAVDFREILFNYLVRCQYYSGDGYCFFHLGT